MDKIWVKIAKKILNADVRGRGSSVISDTRPPDEGGGGSKEHIFADVLYGWPLCCLTLRPIFTFGSRFHRGGSGPDNVWQLVCDSIFGVIFDGKANQKVWDSIRRFNYNEN